MESALSRHASMVRDVILSILSKKADEQKDE